MPRKVKILIVGYTQAGKSTSAEILSDYLRVSYANSSDAIVEQYALAAGLTPAHIRANKSEYRSELFNFGRAKQAVDAFWPQSDLLKTAHIIAGLRNPDEVQAARDHKAYDAILWISRPGCVKGPTDKLDPSCADVQVENDGAISDLRGKLIAIVQGLQQLPELRAS